MESGRINRINLQIANLGLGLKFSRKFPFPRIRRNLVFVFLAQPTKYIGVGRIGRRLGTLNVQTIFMHHPATMLQRIRVRIAYGCEMVEKGVKMGRVGLLQGISCTWVKVHTRKHDLTYAGPFPHTQRLKNIHVYARIELRMHKYKLHTQAQARKSKNIDRSSSSTFS